MDIIKRGDSWKVFTAGFDTFLTCTNFEKQEIEKRTDLEAVMLKAINTKLPTPNYVYSVVCN